MKKTKLVTALFSNYQGFPIFGHDNVRVERYLHSLASIARTGEKIVCYLEKKYLKEYYNFWNIHGREQGYYDIDDFTNIEFKFISVDQFKHYKRMFDLKQKYKEIVEYKMFHEIDWMKLQLLENEIDDEYDYFYWIDCGLSHAGLFPCSASEKPNQKGLGDFKHYSWEWPMYDFGKIFNSNLFPKINNFVGNKLLGLSTTLVYWHFKPLEELLVKLKYYSDTVTNDFYSQFAGKHNIGGIIGGHKKHINHLIAEFNTLGKLCLDNEIIPNHEIIMAAIKWHNPELFEEYLFDTWYHKDTWRTWSSDPKEQNYIKKDTENKIQFYGFFEQIGLVN